MEVLQTLYKKNSKGGIEEWRIQPILGTIIITYGELGGKKIVKEFTVSGKNIGKKNETSPVSQAILEAKAKHTKKLKSGYVTSVEDAKAEKTADIIEGGILPMLAHEFEKHKHKIKYPVFVQYKLDGHRCIAIFDSQGKVTLWTRTRKPITSVPHIIKQLENMRLKDMILDGELYNHGMSFEQITSGAKKYSKELSEELKYYIYDIITPDHFPRRDTILNELDSIYENPNIYFVPSIRRDTEEEIYESHTRAVEDGFEGVMVRTLDRGYEHKRSTQLLKVKSFKDAEFPIVGIKEGDDRTVIFMCQIGVNKIFGATMSGDKEENQKYLKDQTLWADKLLTVKYFRESEEGIPIFPVGLRIREDL